MPCLPGPEAPRALGGVFATAVPEGGEGPSLWDHWRGSAAQILSFRNARSAFAHLVTVLAPPRVWLPAYCCADMVPAARAGGAALLFHAGSECLEPDAQALEAALRPGDLVLGVNHFGRPAEGLRALAQRRSDVTWVEDCAQSADTGVAPWAPYRLFSPRKLLGVADGGVLVDQAGALPAPRQRPAASARFCHAGLLRHRDPEDMRNDAWYAAFQRAEAAMDVTDHAMSAQSLRILQRTALAPIRAARRRNYALLHEALGDLALWSDPAPGWTPLGFVIRVRDAATLGAALARVRIFAPRHWAQLACDVPPQTEAALSRQLLTLPCDQRYGPADMARLIAMVRSLGP